ncbi:MAG: ATP-binding cassette domain-containing protein [Chloroflexia bacterium]|nr:ATP-binding cassette domain-containing protein [Chloroflexia bacterium]
MIAGKDAPRLEIRGLTRRFGDVVANDRLSLSVRPGEIVVLLGENGAGKTTLLRCLAGMLAPDAGEIAIDGRAARFAGPIDALRAGIGTVYQHFALVPAFTVEEQLRLAGWRTGMANGPAELGIEPASRINAMPLNLRQRVEIARAMIGAGKVLLLDEPTSVLAPPEVDVLFATLRRLCANGTAILLITHKLREALAIGDRIIVLRAGQVAGEQTRVDGAWPAAIESELLALMFGAEMEAAQGEAPAAANPLPTTAMETRPPLLSVKQLCTAGGEATSLQNLSLDLWPGEIVAIAGVDGNGQRELAETLTGFRMPTRGTIEIGGRQVGRMGAARMREAGIGFLTDDRLGEGAVATRSVAENLAMTRLNESTFVRRGLLNRRAMARDAAAHISHFDIRPPDPSAPLGTLSGGNVQKVLLARTLSARLRVLICLKATSGLDVRTANSVHRALRAFVDEGRAVLLLTNELEEAEAVGDLVGAIYGGRLSPLIPRGNDSSAALGRFMVGAA